MWLEDMPQAAIDIVQNKRLTSAVALVKLSSDITRPSFQDMRLWKHFSLDRGCFYPVCS